ncbi:MAG: TIGR03960 family B12-binding radical SAM protein [Dethiobacter sp.]|nr:TIGR03960 family B12-binding radical SAM protein [Dethiobacter sp.]
MFSYREYLLEKILPRVQKPTRYLGNELNAVRKEHHTVRFKAVLAFPDLYEVGMSHLGLKILYHIVNETEEWLAERVFAPAPDLESLLLAENLPLFSLETSTPLASFDLIGFTLQYELSYATILQMLILGRVPLLASQRGEGDPLVAGGGPGAFNPEPLADYFDFFVLGDGEEALPAVIRTLTGEKFSSRQDKLRHLSQIRGIYVPGLYQEKFTVSGRYLGTFPVHENLPPRVRRAVLACLEQAPYPRAPVVPYGTIVHDRLVLELFRGCTRGCRFCQAGMVYRPVRERSVAKLKKLAHEMVRRTGYEEMALSSLSSGDFGAICQVVEELGRELAEKGVSLSLPSLRLDSFSGELAQHVRRIRKSGLTFAPEAGTQRLRDVINKNITEEDLLAAVTDAFRAGWSAVKLYFMIGLPTETDEDLHGIAMLVRKVVEAYRLSGGRGKPRVAISAAVFVPKPHTPFQWQGQIPRQEILRRQEYLKRELRSFGREFQWHDAASSVLEAALARGGRMLGAIIARAAALGCRLDSWDEHFSYTRWRQAFAEHGLDLEEYAVRDLNPEEPLPWDHLDTGVAKHFLLQEWARALAGEVTADCRDGCLGCGVVALCQVPEDSCRSEGRQSEGVCHDALLD